MRHFLLLLISPLFQNFLHAKCNIASLSYTLPDCNLVGQTVTINWTATCPDELMNISFVSNDTNTASLRYVTSLTLNS